LTGRYDVPPRFRVSLLFIAVLLAVIAAGTVVGTAWAEPANVTAAKDEVAALRAQIDQSNNDAEIAIEAYNGANDKLQRTDKALKANQAKLDRAEKDLKTATVRLESRAQNIYKGGRMGLLDALLGASSLSEFMNRLELLTRIGSQDSQVLEQVGTYRTEVSSTKAQLTKDKASQQDSLAKTKAAKATVLQKLADQKKALVGKEQLVAQLQREEEVRLAKIAAAAKAAAARARATVRVTSSYTGNAPSGNAPTSQIGGSVIGIAAQFLGVPYVWGGTSPGGFDCSGLVQYVFARAGVSLPRVASDQQNVGASISRANLQPGDLVFFGNPAHHVGIYVGDGTMIHAPHTGSVVRYDSMDRSDFAGGRRVN
jgi:cell wall-associated NlpC family hydrolase